MDSRTGMAILVTIVASGLYRIVVLRRLLAQLDADRPPLDPDLEPGGVRRDPDRRRELDRPWLVRGSDGVAVDPTIVVPGPT